MSHNFRIAYDLAVRDLAARFAQSYLGVFWLLLSPLSYAFIYWLVFSRFLQLTWVDPTTGARVGYLAPFFAGLVGYLFFSELVISSLTVFTRKRDYVRRSPFPLWVLWLSNVLRIGFVTGLNVAVLLVLVLANGLFKPGLLVWLPLALMVLVAASLGLSLILAALGPFYGDLDEGTRLILRVLFYAAPITYPLSLVPERFHALIWLNPITFLVDTLRRASVFGLPPDPLPLAGFLAAVAALGAASVWLYGRLRGAIIDVV